MTLWAHVLVTATITVASLAGLAPTPAVPGDSTITVQIPGGSATSRGAGGSGQAGTGTGTTAVTAVPAAPVAPVVAAGPTAGAPALPLSSETVEVGHVLTATGSGYTPNEQVQFVLYSTPVVIGSVAANAVGVVSLAITIPQVPTGQHVVEATGWQSHRVTNGRFLVVTGGTAGDAVFPRIIWIIVSAGLLLALVALLIAAKLGWIPRREATPTAAARQKVTA